MSIEGELATLAKIAETTGEKAPDRLVKAFRLKHFHRCPLCDDVNMTSWDGDYRKFIIQCHSCDTKVEIVYADIMSNDDDAMFLAIVDAFLATGQSTP
jgi:transcription elongation factor Elf1